jgi:ABC-2 type transport system permease protein
MWPGTVMARFFGKRTAKVGVLWGLAFGSVVYASATGFLSLGGTPAARNLLLGSLANNVGIKVLLGEPYKIFTVGGFIDWRVAGVVAIVGGIWGILAATKMFRGEETSGRWELFLSGQTTARGAALNALAGLGAGLLALFAAIALITFAVGQMHDVGFSLYDSILFAAVLSAPAAMFMAIGAFTSQLMPIRARAGTLAALVFGVAFSLHAIASVAHSVHWLIYLSPLGWIELARPLADPAPLWFIPMLGVVVIFSTLAVYFAGKRDLYASTFADKDSAKPHTRLLNSPLLAALRLTRAATLGWVGGIALTAFMYGSLTKTVAQAFDTPGIFKKAGGQFIHQLQLSGAKIYIGFIFLLLMLLILAYVAGAVGKMREDESEGYLDNLLVRAVNRWQWFGGRVLIITCAIVAAGLFAAFGMWAGQAVVHMGLSAHDFLLAGINAMAPATLLLGIALFVFGFLPRWTTLAAYGVIALSFLVQMVGSAVHLNHWILDLSILQHIALAPAVAPNWHVVAWYVGIGAALILIAGWRFNHRDLQSE